MVWHVVGSFFGREVGKEPSRWILFEFPAPGLKE
jgi:hypothetical protein